MNRSLLSIFILSLLTTIAACKALCTKRLECNGYEGHFMSAWFSSFEEVGKTFYYTDNKGHTDTLIIERVEKKEPYILKHVDNPVVPEELYACKDNYGSIAARVDSQHSGWIYMLLVDHETGEGGNSYSEFQLFYKGYEAAINYGIDNKDIQIQQPDSVHIFSGKVYRDTMLNGRSYTEVLVISTDDKSTAQTQQIDKMYIAKGTGIIGYRTYPDTTTTYWLQ